MGRDFGWLWAAFAAGTLGTRLALDAFPLIAIMVLDAGPAQVSLLAAASGAVGALLAVPLGPWIEFRAKRPLMIRADVVRCLALFTVPAAYALGALSYAQMLAVAMVVAVADIVFVGASGAHLKALVPARHLVRANGRFETVMWISTAVGPPVGGALVGAVGPVVTVVLNAVGHLLSAAGVRAISAPEVVPSAPKPGGPRFRAVAEGWRMILADRVLRLLFGNTVLVSALIMASAPPLTYLLLHDLGFTALEYGLAFGVPCLGGVVGARLARPLERRFGRRRILLGFGVARVPWLAGLAGVGAGWGGLPLVMGVELAMITCMGVFTPVFAAYRLERVEDGAVARVLTAWTITTRTAIAAGTALWGLIAALAGPRTAIGVAGALLVGTVLLLPWRDLEPS
ncbi:MFS transporter [Thermocatellispora tengchongensis]